MALFWHGKDKPNRRKVNGIVTQVAAELSAIQEFVHRTGASTQSRLEDSTARMKYARVVEAVKQRRVKLIQQLARHRTVDLREASRLVTRLGLSNAAAVNEVLQNAARVSR